MGEEEGKGKGPGVLPGGGVLAEAFRGGPRGHLNRLCISSPAVSFQGPGLL